MAEIDTKPFESVQAALSLFEQKIDQKKYSSTSNGEKEKEVDLLMKDLANCKVQLEIKESANIQAVLKLELYHKTIEKLSTQLKLTESDRDKYMEECSKAQACISKLQSGENHEKFLKIVNELKATKEDLLQLKAELSAAEESKVAALRQVELMEAVIDLEKEKGKELLIHIKELNEVFLSPSLAAIEAEKERFAFFSGMETELEIATEAVIQSQEQLEQMKMQFDVMKNLENELLEKTILTDYLLLELKQAKELQCSSLEAASDAVDNLNRLKAEMEMMEKVNTENRTNTLSMEAEAKQIAREKVSDLNDQVETLKSEIQYMKDERSKINEKELELQIEIATLKSEHKGRSKIADADAAEARAMSTQSGLYLAVQQLAVEEDAVKNEAVQNTQAETEMVHGITVSVEEYESLIQKAELVEADRTTDSPLEDESQLPESGSRCEAEILKEELEAANAENSDLRFSVEKAVRRAELAEKAKAAVEDQLRKWREQQRQRRMASEVLREQSVRKHQSLIVHGKTSAYQPPLRSTSLYVRKHPNYVPLGKFLNMEF